MVILLVNTQLSGEFNFQALFVPTTEPEKHIVRSRGGHFGVIAGKDKKDVGDRAVVIAGVGGIASEDIDIQEQTLYT